jgi:hypothetical protein
MNAQTKASPDITRAAERYLEQYGDPLVMNTYLKVTILVLAVVCLALAGLTFKSQSALASMHPMIIRINDVGRAEAIDYRNFQYRPQEAENKYYLTRWAELYFSRNRFTIERDQRRARCSIPSTPATQDRLPPFTPTRPQRRCAALRTSFSAATPRLPSRTSRPKSEKPSITLSMSSASRAAASSAKCCG